MLTPENTALVLLAAGRSRRFEGDKLSEPFLDKPLAYHVVTALAKIPFLTRIAVVSDTRLDFAALGYQVEENPDPSRGQARSLCHGVSVAKQAGAEAVLVALADMPRVTAAHVYRMFDAADGAETIVASSDGVQPRPPALFGKGMFDDLLDLDGDEGARQLIRHGHHVVTSPAELVDVDTRADLEELRHLYGLETDGK
ncbi:molybdenum cofactor cytidylyltransferase [Sphingomonas naasensis]|uniref:Nucleotidyltransferase family protein n=1 Tax=Sphingomonas naasensis TaxID=1344951 RepID=A0A4S1WAM8_9SPHN|nr:nucleotidyltransferase family protein [Sphingomonas naasensis]NIJ19906.1 molybdenum cofactor cytidylyltransferase [Sphingomonas naasensis]TGX39971.1 nucleotidyltransferase family protein [Sphingomonas naasensis]